LQNSFLFMRNPFLSKERRKPSITIGTTIGRCSLIICAVPLRTGLKDFVVPCGKNYPTIIKCYFNVFCVIRVYVFLLMTSFPFERQVRSTVIAPP
jgi:hypothetical protein